MKLALIDNKDSFTFNIVDLLRKIRKCEISVLPSNTTEVEKLKHFDKIIISPGPGLPSEFPNLEKILNAYYKEKPFLGICLGHEAICCFFGADIINLPAVVHGQPRQINVRGNSPLFKNIPSGFNAGLYHSWLVSKENFPDELEITGLSVEGDIMAVHHKEHNLFGVQFHPESVITEYGKQIIENFVNV
jgi:anthranilate synthase/aminodeoxychorismate synthase-like glutamine amidotransferase